ncbi:MAG: YncE family protein [Halieaceae bacterium]
MKAKQVLLPLLLLLVLQPLQAATLLVGNKSAASVSLLDLDSGEEVALALTDPGPHEIAVSADGKLAVVTNYGTAEAPGRSLSVIDIVEGKTVGTIDLGKYTRPHGILFLPDARRALVTAEGAGVLLLVDIYLGVVEAAISTGQRGSHMLAYDASGQRAYVANIASNSVSLINVRDRELLSFEGTGRGAEGIALAANGRDLWVANRGEDTVSLLDARYLDSKEKLELPGFPIRVEIMPLSGKVLVTSARSGELSIIDPQSLAVERTVSLGLQRQGAADGLFADLFGKSSIPIGIEIEPGGGRVWIAHAGADRVQELNPADWSQTRLMKTGREPDAMAYSPLSVASSR